MTSVKILQQLPQLFLYADVQKISGNANVFLTRALHSGMVERVVRGGYINSFLKGYPALEEVACFLRSPSYMFCEWALNLHGILTQSPALCTVLTLSTSVGNGRNFIRQGQRSNFPTLQAASSADSRVETALTWLSPKRPFLIRSTCARRFLFAMSWSLTNWIITDWRKWQRLFCSHPQSN